METDRRIGLQIYNYGNTISVQLNCYQLIQQMREYIYYGAVRTRTNQRVGARGEKVGSEKTLQASRSGNGSGCFDKRNFVNYKVKR